MAVIAGTRPASKDDSYSQFIENAVYRVGFLVMGVILGVLMGRVLWHPTYVNDWNTSAIRLEICNGETPCKAAGDKLGRGQRYADENN